MDSKAARCSQDMLSCMCNLAMRSCVCGSRSDTDDMSSTTGFGGTILPRGVILDSSRLPSFTAMRMRGRLSRRYSGSPAKPCTSITRTDSVFQPEKPAAPPGTGAATNGKYSTSTLIRLRISSGTSSTSSSSNGAQNRRTVSPASSGCRHKQDTLIHTSPSLQWMVLKESSSWPMCVSPSSVQEIDFWSQSTATVFPPKIQSDEMSS
mmetsp:Transcript_676/g.1490  ORF Transcript_676/g.1490 Transcript_676/m.1490 type:complete len:207 (-) Transcript_676:520-1140(-)